MLRYELTVASMFTSRTCGRDGASEPEGAQMRGITGLNQNPGHESIAHLILSPENSYLVGHDYRKDADSCFRCSVVPRGRASGHDIRHNKETQYRVRVPNLRPSYRITRQWRRDCFSPLPSGRNKLQIGIGLISRNRVMFPGICM